MPKGLRGRLSYANVVSTIALFVALGGGYALAVSGKGSLQKAGVDGLSTSFANVRSLAGFGMIQARCDTVDDEVEFRFLNSTTKELHVFGANSLGTQIVNLGVAPDEQDEVLEAAGVNS